MKSWWKSNWYQVAAIILTVSLFFIMLIDGFYILDHEIDYEFLNTGNAYQFIFNSQLDGALPIWLLNLLFPLALIAQIATHIVGLIKGESKFGPLVEIILVWTIYFMTWSMYLNSNLLRWLYPLILAAITVIDGLSAYFRNRFMPASD